jgi:predicted MPP superfamily phosphohydrolase
MAFGKFIIMMFAVIGLIDGSILALVFRKRRFYLWSLGGAIAGAIPAWYFNWYGLAYDSYGFWSLYLAYLLDGIMVACLIIPIPAFILGILSFIPGLRYFISNLGKGLIAIALVIGVYGCVMGNSREVVEYHDIYVKDLPAAFDGYKVAQETDTHIGAYFRYTDMPAELLRAKNEGADVLFFTGDLIDDVRYMPQVAEDFTKAEKYFPDGIFYIWGNHEYYRNQPLIEEDLKNTPVKMLVNNHTYIEKDGQRLYVAGVDFPFARGTQKEIEEKKWADEAFAGIPRGAPVIFLAHHSDFIDQGFKHGAFLTLTGHTHGTQFGLFGKPIITPFKYTRGMYSDGNHYGYVARGDASWFPFRFSCPRELTIFTLHRA